jgi:hypothetical protein
MTAREILRKNGQTLYEVKNNNGTFSRFWQDDSIYLIQLINDMAEAFMDKDHTGKYHCKNEHINDRVNSTLKT